VSICSQVPRGRFAPRRGRRAPRPPGWHVLLLPRNRGGPVAVRAVPGPCGQAIIGRLPVQLL